MPTAFAKAAKCAIVEVDEIVEVGEIPPELVNLPGIFVHRLVQVPPEPEGLWPAKRQERRR